MLSKLYDFIIRKHLEILTIIFVGISLILLSQTENHIILRVQSTWQDVSVFLKRPAAERQRKLKVLEQNKELRMEVFRLNQELARLQNLDIENEAPSRHDRLSRYITL